MPVTYEDKLACANRELAMRQRVYPDWIARRKMTREKADHEIAVMQAIADDYAILARDERLI
jgi:hypothetical protein